jgi:hypothetical protein
MEILAERAEADRGSRTRESGLLQSSLRRLGKLRFYDPLYGTQPAAVAFGGVWAFRKEQNRPSPAMGEQAYDHSRRRLNTSELRCERNEPVRHF